MHHNEMINVKSSFEMLCDADLEDEVTHKGKLATLHELFFEQEDNGNKLFVAME